MTDAKAVDTMEEEKDESTDAGDADEGSDDENDDEDLLLDIEEFAELSFNEQRAYLKKNDLSAAGRKADLI